MHLLPLSLWGPRSFFSSDNYHKIGCCQSLSSYHLQYFKWEIQTNVISPRMQVHNHQRSVTYKQTGKQTFLEMLLCRTTQNSVEMFNTYKSLQEGVPGIDRIATAESLLWTPIHNSRSPGARIIAPGSERCTAEILIWIGYCSFPQFHSVLLKMPYCILEVVDERKKLCLSFTH